MDVMTAFAFCMVLLLVLLLVGVPLPYCFAGALIFMVATCGIPIKSLFVWGYSQMISTSLMAVPMFIIAGNLIAESSIAEKLVDLARIFVGKVKGALGCICVVVCGIMGAISGSAFTGIAALGSIMIPELQKEGYSRGFATSLVTCSSILGTLIPPSIPIIVLGWTTGISILGCFMATVVPGIMLVDLVQFPLSMCSMPAAMPRRRMQKPSRARSPRRSLRHLGLLWRPSPLCCCL